MLSVVMSTGLEGMMTHTGHVMRESLFIVRSTCNVCNGPKFVEVEERTGLGGGFDERGVVEYKDRAHSDDEYDDFGRRKKKKGVNGRIESRPQETIEVEDEDEEEEEDEDEEDDGDVSKYDLWGDDDDEKGKEEKKEAPKLVLMPPVKSQEKSRSRSKEKKKPSRRSRSRYNRQTFIFKKIIPF